MWTGAGTRETHHDRCHGERVWMQRSHHRRVHATHGHSADTQLAEPFLSHPLEQCARLLRPPRCRENPETSRLDPNRFFFNETNRRVYPQRSLIPIRAYWSLQKRAG